jgi:hypothetical protein
MEEEECTQKDYLRQVKEGRKKTRRQERRDGTVETNQGAQAK